MYKCTLNLENEARTANLLVGNKGFVFQMSSYYQNNYVVDCYRIKALRCV